VRVLVAEDDPISQRVLETMLNRWGYETIVASDGLEAWELLSRPDAPPVAILDWMMPEMSGLDVCRRARKAQGNEYLYVVLLTAKGRQEDIIEGMNAGADDYITKPFDSGELRVRLRAAERTVSLQAELAATRDALRAKAAHDPLTGLWSRPAILDTLNREIARSLREGGPVGLVLADVDGFKAVNDCYGRRAGEHVLYEAAQRIRDIVRPYDGLSRYAADEFLAILPGCDLAFARSVAERLRAAVAETPFGASIGLSIPVTVSVGVAARLSAEGCGPEELVAHAELAVNHAKQAGRNRVEFASRTLSPSAE